MRRSTLTVFPVLLSLLIGAVVPLGLSAQEKRALTDFRGRTDYTDEDLAKSLFPEASSDVRLRGIGPQQPTQATASPPAARPSVALNVFFEFNSDKILPEYYPDIDKLGRVLTQPQYNGFQVQIEGHTDSIGSDGYNQALSQRRAESVRRYLVQHFPIEANRLIVKGFGKTRPIASNETPEGRSQNRRVEVVNLGKK
jgi:outer membrane protein OmpA-like peptidoglycan-associated protein